MFPPCCVERPSREPWGTRKYEKKRFQKMLTCETFLMQSRCLKSIKRMDNARQLLMCALFRTRVERVHPRLGNYSNAPSYSRALDLSTYIVQWIFQARETYTFHMTCSPPRRIERPAGEHFPEASERKPQKLASIPDIVGGRRWHAVGVFDMLISACFTVVQ